jgi:hypothetical protein
VSPDVVGRAQSQARLQVASEDDRGIRYEILDPERQAADDTVLTRSGWQSEAGVSPP